MQDILWSTLRLAVPLIFAAYGGMLSERSGIANIALESYLLVSAFAAATVTYLSGSLALGVMAGLVAAGTTGFLFAIVCVYGRGDQIVVGTAFNLLAVGVLPVMNKALFNITGSTPALPVALRFSEPLWFFVLALLVTALFAALFRFTRHGIRITAAGENPQALVTQGVSFRKVRIRAVVEGSLIAGIGGIYLSLCQGSGYVREMSAGRGFIALAALIFGAWRPVPTLLACLFFALTDALQIQLQGVVWRGVEIPNQFVQIIPYAATILVLILYARKISAPAAINQDR